MEEKDLQEKKEEKIETKEEKKGYYLAEVTTQTGIVLIKDGKQISDAELLVKVANAVDKAGLFK